MEEVLPAGVEVIEGWGWKPGADEFIPDVLVFDEPDDDRRLTAVPHLAVEDPEGPEVIVHGLVAAVLVEQARHGPGQVATLDVGPAQVSFDPAVLLR